MKQLKIKLGLRYTPVPFSNIRSAYSFAENCVSSMWVVLGDDNRFWVVCPADFEKLIKAGYQPA